MSFDLEVVSADLHAVPLDEVLHFKRENAAAHRKYMQNLRTFAANLSVMDPGDRERALIEHQQDLRP